MIYDRALTVYETEPGYPPTAENLTQKRQHLFAGKNVSIKRFYASVQAGSQIDRVVVIPGWFQFRAANEYIRADDGELYDVVQVDRQMDDDGWPVMWISLELHSRTWADTLDLLQPSSQLNADGYDSRAAPPTRRTVSASIVSGVDNADSYSGDKSALRRSTVLEIYSADYQRERQAVFRGQTYDVESAVETERFTLRLTLREVLR